jgi:hypothetical protein
LVESGGHTFGRVIPTVSLFFAKKTQNTLLKFQQGSIRRAKKAETCSADNFTDALFRVALLFLVPGIGCAIQPKHVCCVLV